MRLAFGFLSARAVLLGLTAGFFTLEAAQVRLVAPALYREGVPLVVRVELVAENGEIAKEVWESQAVLEVNGAGAVLSENRLPLINGLGTALLAVSGQGDFLLSAEAGSARSTERLIKNAEAAAVREVSGTLPGETTEWSGVVWITGDVTVPAGHRLTIAPGTLVMIDGVNSGTAGVDILVSGEMSAFGTEEEPVTITCASEEANWGQIQHLTGSKGAYVYAHILKGGRASGEGHTSAGPVLRVSGSEVRLENCTISDARLGSTAVGKGMYARNSELVFERTVFARMRMGPEIEGTGLVCSNSYFMEMRGPDDSDGIYLHNSDGKALTVSGCVFAGGDDDAIDTLNSDVTVTDCIFRGWLNPNEDAKAISVFNGEVQVDQCLIADCYSGISAKTGSGRSALVQVTSSTIVTLTNGVTAAWKANAPGPAIYIGVTNCIVVGSPAIASHFGSTNVNAGFSLLSTAWEGVGNLVADPLFVDAEMHDYNLREGSPGIDAGDPAGALDEDGSRADVGRFPFSGGEARLAASILEGALELRVDMEPGKAAVIESSPDLEQWQVEKEATEDGGVLKWRTPLPGTGNAHLFFRARVQ